MPELDAWAVALAGSPWMFVVLYACAAVDGFFPPVPSESVVILLAAWSAAGGNSDFWLLGTVAAAGAFTGDQLAYSIGRRFPVHGMRVVRSERARRAVTWAERALADRGAACIIGARFVPVGRVAVNMTAGTVGFSRARFSVLAAGAAMVWSAYALLLGVGASQVLGHPLLGAAVGIAGGLMTGALVDGVLRQLRARRRRQDQSSGWARGP